MSNEYQPLTALDRARIAYEEMVRRQQAVATARQLRGRKRKIRAAIVCGGIAVLLIACTIHYDLVPTSLRSGILSRNGTDADFGTTRTGQVRTYVKGNTCQELQFNNVSGGYVGGAFVPCDTVLRKEAPPSTSGQRVNSIRDSFTR